MVLILLVGMFFILIPRLKRQNLAVVESAQLQGIHQGWLIYAGEFDGHLPVPGAIKRLPRKVDGQSISVPGEGPIDDSQNTTAHLYSATIMLNYFTPEVCVGPAEPSPRVRPATGAGAYDFASYAPANGAYWDEDFKADLHGESNVSYAHMPLWGLRFERQWRDSADPGFPLLGHRGPKDGTDAASITLRILPPFDSWRGIVVHADNSTEVDGDVEWGEVRVDVNSEFVPDCYFRFEEGPIGGDAILTFTKSMGGSGPETQWD